MKKLVLETTAPFQGLPELVADQEGLFAKGSHDIILGQRMFSFTQMVNERGDIGGITRAPALDR